MRVSSTLMLVGALTFGSAVGAFAGTSAQMQGAESGKPTISQLLANGTMTEPQLVQLVEFTGLTPDQAKSLTLDEISVMRWKN